jgi:hypothetical protein
MYEIILDHIPPVAKRENKLGETLVVIDLHDVP